MLHMSNCNRRKGETIYVTSRLEHKRSTRVGWRFLRKPSSAVLVGQDATPPMHAFRNIRMFPWYAAWGFSRVFVSCRETWLLSPHTPFVGATNDELREKNFSFLVAQFTFIHPRLALLAVVVVVVVIALWVFCLSTTSTAKSFTTLVAGGGGGEKKFSFFASSAPDFSTRSQHRTRLNHGKRWKRKKSKRTLCGGQEAEPQADKAAPISSMMTRRRLPCCHLRNCVINYFKSSSLSLSWSNSGGNSISRVGPRRRMTKCFLPWWPIKTVAKALTRQWQQTVFSVEIQLRKFYSRSQLSEEEGANKVIEGRRHW